MAKRNHKHNYKHPSQIKTPVYDPKKVVASRLYTAQSPMDPEQLKKELGIPDPQEQAAADELLNPPKDKHSNRYRDMLKGGKVVKPLQKGTPSDDRSK